MTPGFADGEADDSCTPYLQALVHELRRRPATTVSIVALHYPYRDRPYPWHGVEVHPCNGGNRPWRRWRAWRRARAAFDTLHDEQPVTHVHAFWLGECALLGQRIARRHRLPLVVTAMGREVESPDRFARRLDRSGLTTAVLSDFHQAVLTRTSGSAADAVVPIGVDPEAHIADDLPRDIDLLGVGSLTSGKRFADFLEVAAILARTRPGLTGTIVGDGPERSRLEAAVGRLGLTGTVELSGQQSRASVLKLMRRSRLLLQPSEYESLGYACLEALLQGTPVVSRPVGIAAPSPFWRVANDIDGLATAAGDMLSIALPEGPLVPYRIDATVDRFLALYDSR